VAILRRWGAAVLASLAQPRQPGTGPGTAAQLAESEGGRQDFRAPLRDWGELLKIGATTEQGVRSQGLYHGCAQALAPPVTALARTARGQRVTQHFLAVVETASATAARHERFRGSREGIESVLGKLTRLEPPQAQSGVPGLLLAVGARVSTTTPEVIPKALETLPTRQVRQWCQQPLGPAVQAQRQQAFRRLKPAEEKQSQFQQAA
jgi:hypothetical protein